MAARDYHAIFPDTWVRSGNTAAPSVQSYFIADNYSLLICGAGMGTQRVEEVRNAAVLHGATLECAWYTKACGLHDPGAGAEDETSYGWATMSGRNALARASYPAGLAITNRWNGWRFVDIVDNEGSGNRTAWITSQNALLDSMQARVDLEGVYLDNAGVMIVTGSNSFTVNSLGNAAAPGGYTDTAWYTAIKAIVDGVASVQTGKNVWFNSYLGFASSGQRGLSLLQNSYGMFAEGWAYKTDGTGTPGYWSRSRFKQQIDDIVTALASYGGRHVVVIDDCNQADTTRRMFKLGAYLLAYNNTTRLKEFTRVIDTATDLDYCKEYDSALTQLGAPSAVYTDDGTFLTREYAGGKVVVNPDSGAHEYTLPSGVWEMLETSEQTQLGVNVTWWSAVGGSSVSMPARSALVLRQVGGETQYTITSGGLTRRYTVYLPSPLPAGKIPAVVALHGGGTNSNFMRTQSGFNTVADANGFAVIYPDGTPDGSEEYWNAYGGSSEINDVEFLGDIRRDLPDRMDVDLGRFYVVGFSNGGKMAHRYAAQRPNVVAACVGVSGGITTLDDPAGDPVPILHIHGASDPTVPYAGGEGVPPGDYPNLDIEGAVMPYWATRNGNDTTPTTTTPTGYTKKVYTDSGTATELYRVTAGLHEWDFGSARDANLPGGSTEAAVWAFLSPLYRAPVAALTLTPTSGSASLLVTLDASGSTALDDVLEYAFDTGGGSFGAWQDGSSTTVTLAAGSYTLRAKVRDWAERESAIVTEAITVSAAVPTVTLAASPSSGDSPLAVTLTASASGGSGAPFTYSFDLGQGAGYGAYGSSATAGATYTTGTYTARVKAKDSATTESAAATATILASVVAAPTVTFTASKTTARRFERITLTWSTTGCTSVRAEGQWSGALATSGTFGFTPYRTGIYDLGVVGRNSAGVEVMATVRIKVTGIFGGGASFLGVP